jgi:hypothetical protein
MDQPFCWPVAEQGGTLDLQTQEAPVQDEHFQRDWTQSHDRFAHDVDAGLKKLRDVLTGMASACGRGLRRKADATVKAVLAGFILGAALGGAVLASIEAAPSHQDTAEKPASVRITSTRTAMA